MGGTVTMVAYRFFKLTRHRRTVMPAHVQAPAWVNFPRHPVWPEGASLPGGEPPAVRRSHG